MKKNILLIVFLAISVSLLSGLFGAKLGINWYQSKNIKTNDEMVKSYFNDEMAATVSPVDVRALIDKKDKNYVLVDLRSKIEYDNEHIISAINIPAASMNKDQLLTEFNKLPKDKEIIVYCYSAYCTLGRQVGQFLANKDIYIKDMNVGWSEWRYYWGLWNPGEDPKVGNNYIIKGTGTSAPAGSCIQGEFGC